MRLQKKKGAIGRLFTHDLKAFKWKCPKDSALTLKTPESP